MIVVESDLLQSKSCSCFCACRKQRKKLHDRLRQSLRERHAAAKGPQHPHPPPENLQLVNVSTVTGNVFNPLHCSVEVVRKNDAIYDKISGRQVL